MTSEGYDTENWFSKSFVRQIRWSYFGIGAMRMPRLVNLPLFTAGLFNSLDNYALCFRARQIGNSKVSHGLTAAGLFINVD
jgi:hypothetical protein